jgi:hypothetical protein
MLDLSLAIDQYTDLSPDLVRYLAHLSGKFRRYDRVHRNSPRKKLLDAA